jgi:hypothetical protein
MELYIYLPWKNSGLSGVGGTGQNGRRATHNVPDSQTSCTEVWKNLGSRLARRVGGVVRSQIHNQPLVRLTNAEYNTDFPLGIMHCTRNSPPVDFQTSTVQGHWTGRYDASWWVVLLVMSDFGTIVHQEVGTLPLISCQWRCLVGLRPRNLQWNKVE